MRKRIIMYFSVRDSSVYFLIVYTSLKLKADVFILLCLMHAR